MQIEIVMPYRCYEPGQRFDWDASIVEILVRRGIVKVVEKSVDAPPANKMIASPARKKALVTNG